MKTRFVLLLATLVSGTALAGESRSRANPQPRVRLDPYTRAAIAEPRKEEGGASSTASIVVMSPFIVRSIAITANGPEQQQQPEGPFSLLDGGRIHGWERNGKRIEFGVWPYFNVMWKSDRFKSDPKHVGTAFFRVSW